MNLTSSTIKADMLVFWILATISICLGLFINQLKDKPLPLVYQNKEERLMQEVATVAVPLEVKAVNVSSVSRPELVDLPTFRGIVEKKQALIVDARPEIFYRVGHIPTAISLPRDDFEKVYATNPGSIASRKSDWIVIYCSSVNCEDSNLVHKALDRMGYTQVSVFRGGWNDWIKANLPTEVRK